jgi:hypothetical protein
MRPDPKYVLDLAAKLEAAKEAVERLQAEWDKLFPDTFELATPQDRSPRPESAISKTLDFINANPDKEFNAVSLAATLELPAPSMRTNLAKLFKDGKLNKRGDGLYRSLQSTLEDEAATAA